MDDSIIHSGIISQYNAALEMLRLAVAACPAGMWDTAPAKLSAFWRVAHHTIWFADLYVSPSEADFKPWPKHVDDHQHLGLYRSFKENALARIGTPTTQAEMLEFVDHVRARIAPAVTAAPLDGPSGFSWLPFTKLEAHLYNMRHIQHHAGHLIGRLREQGIEVDWVGRWPRPPRK